MYGPTKPEGFLAVSVVDDPSAAFSGSVSKLDRRRDLPALVMDGSKDRIEISSGNGVIVRLPPGSSAAVIVAIATGMEKPSAMVAVAIGSRFWLGTGHTGGRLTVWCNRDVQRLRRHDHQFAIPDASFGSDHFGEGSDCDRFANSRISRLNTKVRGATMIDNTCSG